MSAEVCIRWGGAILIVAAAIILGREYSKYIARQKKEMRAFSDLILHIKGEVSRFLTPTAALLSGYECPVLESSGFASAFAAHSDLSRALEESDIVLPRSFHALLSEFFADFGKDYREGELARILHYSELLEREEERLISELDSSEKLAKTLLVAAALAIIILII